VDKGDVLEAEASGRKNLVRTVAVGAAWLAGTAAAVRLGELVVGRSPLGAALAGAVIVDLATYRAGVRWDARDDDKPNARKRLVRGLGVGVLVSLVLASVPLVVSVAALGAKVSLGSLSSSLAFGLLRAAAVGTRDELLLRGLPLVVAKRAGLALPWAIGFGALAGACALAMVPGASWEALVLALSQGLLFGVLFARTGAAYAPVAAHAGWVLFSGVGLRGGLLDVAWTGGVLADGARARGAPAIVAALVALASAFVVWRRKPSPIAS